MRGRYALLLGGLAILLSGTSSYAFHIVGPRALGMGGSSVRRRITLYEPLQPPKSTPLEHGSIQPRA